MSECVCVCVCVCVCACVRACVCVLNLPSNPSEGSTLCVEVLR